MPDQFDLSAYAKRLAFVAKKSQTSIFYHLKILEGVGVISTKHSEHQKEYAIRGSWIELEVEPRRGFLIQVGACRVVLLPGRVEHQM